MIGITEEGGEETKLQRRTREAKNEKISGMAEGQNRANTQRRLIESSGYARKTIGKGLNWALR